MILDGIENFIRWNGVATGLATLVIALWQGVWRGLQWLSGQTTGNAQIEHSSLGGNQCRLLKMI